MSASRISSVTADAVKVAGIDVKKPNGLKQSMQFEQDMMRWAEQFRASNNRVPNDMELQQRANEQLLPIVLNPPGWNNEQSGSLFSIDFDEVTPGDVLNGTLTVGGERVEREAIQSAVEAFTSAVGREPTAAEVVELLSVMNAAP